MPKNPDVNAWLSDYENPMKPVVTAMRERIMAAIPDLEEAIKWQAPTFFYEGNIASFFPNAKKHASLMFHKGADIPGTFPNLEGDGKEARSFKVSSIEDLDAREAELLDIFRAWIALKDS